MGKCLLAKNSLCLNHTKKEKKVFFIQYVGKKIWAMQDIEPGTAAPMISNEDGFFSKGKIKII